MNEDQQPRSTSLTSMETPLFTPAEAVDILRQHHGLRVGGLRKGVEAPYLPFEKAVGIAIMHEDTAVTEVLTALIGLV